MYIAAVARCMVVSAIGDVQNVHCSKSLTSHIGVTIASSVPGAETVKCSPLDFLVEGGVRGLKVKSYAAK